MDQQQQEARESMTATKRQEQCSVLDALRRHYLFMYNLLQFLGFSWTFSLLTANLILHGQGAVYSAFSSCATVLYGCQMLAVLEVINAAVGLIKTPVIPAMIQVMGRNVVLFVVFGSLQEMQERSVVFWVFYLWSISEVFRLAFPVLSLDAKFGMLIWLRHTLLYPLTTLTEAVAVLQSLPLFDQTRLFSVPLPEAVGFSVSFSFSLRLYLLLMFFGFFINIRHLVNPSRRAFRLKPHTD
ncbi:very-long-chain (3R)-3-hydroxyacyl-CoA dehydratase-like isoform X1 [Neoarius graeffei]|uniref:very-long-chain (3R)-3-hydroxyacyl-CoA dehydratase-like isoform X1 n=2 Tax=Neoarius graeffei TaxID=443677 RepID=UPI00298C0DF0|nr:very-long-chain (3R)-3-hydroxyacyl-CoA dehydratase-like isoform X1 [Neoarius graeffei]XP_060797865.1 very-long-chain (3R)-3-hydroxyacyl-CoA dehydratase-like isoform X1 [Neoarius graeffei]XP_060797866.1 very-long-chain (3R)-3-hydroxyacyl-CoA dehydratase-like isoform X1 [Neoarius graeffei]